MELPETSYTTLIDTAKESTLHFRVKQVERLLMYAEISESQVMSCQIAKKDLRLGRKERQEAEIRFQWPFSL